MNQHRILPTPTKRLCTFFAGLLVLAAGCSKPAYDIRPVKGTVKVEGRPMTAGRIMFAPVATGSDINPGKPAFGYIESDGGYTLTTYSDCDGAVVGEHSVTIFDTSESAKFSRLMLPIRRNVQSISDNVIDLNVTAEEVKKFGVRE